MLCASLPRLDKEARTLKEQNFRLFPSLPVFSLFLPWSYLPLFFLAGNEIVKLTGFADKLVSPNPENFQGETALQVKVLATKPDDMSSVSRTNMWKNRKKIHYVNT